MFRHFTVYKIMKHMVLNDRDCLTFYALKIGSLISHIMVISFFIDFEI